MVGFLRAVYDHVRKEVAAVTVFDGDDAGVRARKELQGFFSGRGEFQPNIDFVSVRMGYPMEGIFPDEWIKECNQENSNWFKSWSVDAAGIVEPFEVDIDTGLLEPALVDGHLPGHPARPVAVADLQWLRGPGRLPTHHCCRAHQCLEAACQTPCNCRRNHDLAHSRLKIL